MFISHKLTGQFCSLYEVIDPELFGELRESLLTTTVAYVIGV
jgi:hypothetical protein